MVDFNNTFKNVVKLRSATNTGGAALVQAKPKINISQLARETGLSRQTVRRKLANGWQPPTAPSVEIIEPTQSVATTATPPGHHGQHSGSLVAATVLAVAAVTLRGIQLAIH